jgi:hypothetical protein
MTKAINQLLQRQAVIAIDLHQFRGTVANWKRCRTTCGVTPKRAAISPHQNRVRRNRHEAPTSRSRD